MNDIAKELPRRSFATYRHLAANGATPKEVPGLIFLREDIERCDLRIFLSAFDMDQMKAEVLRSLMGRVFFGVHGYDDDARELPEIPQVHYFMRKLLNQWPYLLFFSELKTSTPATLFLSSVSETCLRLPGQWLLSEMAKQELEQIIQRAVQAMKKPWALANLTDAEYNARVAAIYNYFKLNRMPGAAVCCR